MTALFMFTKRKIANEKSKKKMLMKIMQQSYAM